MELTEHEKTLWPLLLPENRPLLDVLSEAERKSLAKYVTPHNVMAVQDAIGADEEIEALLFWDKGAKFDDSDWRVLEPVDGATSDLMAKVTTYFQAKKKEAVQYQRRSDLTLLSQFNPGLLFTGYAGAVRCDESGKPDMQSGYFRGVEFRMTGSVSDRINSLTIMPRAEGGFEVFLGTLDTPGILLDMGDPFTLIQVLQLVDRDLPKAGLRGRLYDTGQNRIAFDIKAVRKAARMGKDHGLPREARLHVRVTTVDPNLALTMAEKIARTIYKRLGLEIEITKLGRKYGNFFLVRNENFSQFMALDQSRWRGAVFLTATLECRRCRRELPLFHQMAQSYPDVKLGLVNMNAPHANFHHRVFGDMAGGDPDRFVLTAEGATPFTIVYRPDSRGILTYQDYIATGKEEKPPAPEDVLALLNRYFPAV